MFDQLCNRGELHSGRRQRYAFQCVPIDLEIKDTIVVKRGRDSHRATIAPPSRPA